MSRSIALVPYNTEWPNLARREIDELRARLAASCIDIQHIGSTSIENMPSKNTIDLMIGVPEDILSIDAHMLQAGYRRSRVHHKTKRRMFFKRSPISYNVHIFIYNSSLWRQHLLFRDFLRTHPSAAMAYLSLKRDLATRYKYGDRRYSGGKSDFVKAVVKHASTHMAETGSPYGMAWPNTWSQGSTLRVWRRWWWHTATATAAATAWNSSGKCDRVGSRPVV